MVLVPASTPQYYARPGNIPSHLATDSDGYPITAPPPYQYIEGPTPIDHLPAELLQFIFLLASSTGSTDPDLPEVRRSQSTVLSCASVCGTWRRAAWSAFELWAVVLDFQRMSIPRLELLLELSRPALFNIGHRSAPVALHGLDYKPHHKERLQKKVQLLHAHRDRIREIHVDWGFFGTGIADDFCIDFCRIQEMNKLEVLSWRGSGPVDWSAHAAAVPPTSPAIPLVNNTYRPPKSLRRYDVELAFVRLVPPTALLPALTQLALWRPASSNTLLDDASWGLMEFSAVRELLWATPRLRFLSVDGVLRDDTSLAWGPEKIDLPDLVVVSIAGTRSHRVQASFALFASIAPNPRCSLLVTSSTDRPTWRDEEAWRTVVADMFEWYGTYDMTLHVCADEQDTCTVSNIASARENLDWRHMGGERVATYVQTLGHPILAFSFRNRAGASPQPTAYLEPLAPMVKTLQMSLAAPKTFLGRSGRSCHLQVMARAYILAFSDSVTSLSLNEYAAGFCLKILLEHLDSPLMPALESMKLCACDMLNNQGLWTSLVEFVGQRAKIGYGLELVTFYQSVVPDQDTIFILGAENGCTFLVEEPSGIDVVLVDYMAFSRRKTYGA